MKFLSHWLDDRTNRWVLYLLLGGLLLRTVIALWLYPGFDEAYYYLYTLYPDWSYFDHPLLVGWLTGIGVWLTGNVSQFTIRLGTLVLYTGTLVLLHQTSRKLFGRQTALLTLAIVTFTPFFLLAFGTLIVPDVPLMFFWTATLYVAADEFFPELPRSPVGEAIPEEGESAYRPSYRLALICVLVGLSCLGKYHGFALGAGLVGFCLSSPRQRSALSSPWLLLGLGLFGVTISPILIWNAQHDWISLKFQSRRSIPTRAYNPLDLLATFLGHVAYLFPTFGFPLWWVSLKSAGTVLSRGLSKTQVQDQEWEKQLLLLWLSLPLMVGFTLMGGYQQILPSWPMPGFWTATLLLGDWAALWQSRSPRAVRRWIQGSAIAVCTLLMLALSHVAIGIVQKPGDYAPFGGFWSAKDDPSTQLIDIQQLRQGFVESPVLMQALQESAFVFSNRFFVAGQVAMALTPISQKPITVFDEDLRGFAFWSRPDQWLGQDALYVTSELFQEGEDFRVKYGDYFDSIEKVGDVTIQRGGTVTAVFPIYQAKNLKQPYPRPYGN